MAVSFDPQNFVAPAPGGGFVVYVGGRNIGTFASQSEAEQAFNRATGQGGEEIEGEFINQAIIQVQAQIAQQAAYQAYLNRKLELVDIPLAETEKERLAMQAAQEAARQAQDWVRTQIQAGTEYGRQMIDLARSMAQERQNLTAQLLDLLRTQGQLGLQGAQAATQEALGVGQLIASLRGPRNAFQQQAVMHGLNELGVSRALDALAGKYTLPAFQAPQAAPQAATLQTLVEDLRATGTPGQSAIDQFLQSLPGLMNEGRAALYGYQSPLEGVNLPLGQVFPGVMGGVPGPVQTFAQYAMGKIGGPQVPQDWYDRMVQWYDQFRQTQGRRPTADEWAQAFASFTGLPATVGQQMYQLGSAYVQQTGGRAGPELQNQWLQGILSGATLTPPTPPAPPGGMLGAAAFTAQPVGMAAEPMVFRVQPVGGVSWPAGRLWAGVMPQSFGGLMQLLGRPPATQKPQPPALPRTAGEGQMVALGMPGGQRAAGQAPPTGTYLQNLPAPNQIVAREWLKMPKDTQEFFLSAYEAAGWSPNDVLETIQRTLPQFRAPTLGVVR